MSVEGAVMVDDRMLMVPEVAARLRVTEQAVREWLRTGKLRGYRPGGTRVGWRVRASDLEQFLEASANRPDGQQGGE